MRFFLAFLPTTVLRMAHETSPLRATRMVAARTTYEPQAMWGTKSRTSTRKLKRQTRKVTMPTMNSTSRYLAEWDGLWKWAMTARTNMTRVRTAATGCTMRSDERVERVDEGRSKSPEFRG